MVLQYICFVLSEFWAFPPISVLVIIMEDMTVKSAIHNALYCHNVMLLLQVLLLTAKPIAWPFSVFIPKQVFWPSYCQISTDLYKILHTPIVVRNTLVGRLRSRSARGRLQIKSERLCFYPRDVVSAVYATATWLGGWLSVTAGIASKQLNLS